MTSDSQFIGREPCPSCGSRDNLARYSDGHAYCFSMGCEYYEHGEGEGFEQPRKGNRKMAQAGLITDGEFKALSKRNISEESVRKFGYQTATFKGRPVQVAPYYNKEGQVVAQKVRFPDKDFTILGNFSEATLFGQNLWSEGGRKVVVTEGEIDALTVSQMQNHKWPVVSIPNGAQGAVKSLRKQLDWLESFEEVVLMFDMDEPGQQAAIECAELFSPGKCKLATLPHKDPNECLQKGEGDVIIRAIWNARTYRPDGIINGVDLWDTLSNTEEVPSIPYPWDALNNKTRGLRLEELVTFTAGSGIGKSAIVREIAYHLLKRGETVGMIMLEENVKRTALGLMGLEIDTPLHLSREGVSEDQFKEAFDNTLGTGRLYLYDHFGSTAVDNLLSKVRYLARALECKWIILDHLSIVVSGLDDDEGDERKLIDRTMTMLRTLVQETGIGLLLVSHLKRPQGIGHEDGAKTSLAQLRGSAAIGQLSDLVIGVERNQQGEDPNLSTLRILKNRYTGETGVGCHLRYDKETGRLYEDTGPSGFTDETLVRVDRQADF